MFTGPNAAFLFKQIAFSEIHGELVEDIEYGTLIRNNGYWLALWDLAAAPTIELIIKDVQKKAAADGTSFAGCMLLLDPKDEAGAQAREISEALFVYSLAEPPEHKGYPDQVQLMAKPAFPKAKAKFNCSNEPGSTTGASVVAELNPGSAEMLGPIYRATAGTTSVDTSTGQLGSSSSTVIAHASSGICRRLLAIKPGGGEDCLGLTIKSIAEYSAEKGEIVLTCWSSRKGTLRYALEGLGFATQLIVRFHIAE